MSADVDESCHLCTEVEVEGCEREEEDEIERNV